jgi:hypothetical protein
MVKTIEVEAGLDTIQKIEATGLPSHWNCDKGVLIVDLNSDDTESLVKFAQALGNNGFTLRCLRETPS